MRKNEMNVMLCGAWLGTYIAPCFCVLFPWDIVSGDHKQTVDS